MTATTTPNGLLETWSGACAPGGWVCAWPDPNGPDGICGTPVESEPCTEHNPDWVAE
jgi:hypothetical protein